METIGSFFTDLSEDSLDLSSSFQNISETEIYLSSSEINKKKIKSNMITPNSFDKFEVVKTSTCPDNSGLHSVENSSALFDLSTLTLSINRFDSEIKELQQVASDINDQYIKQKTSKFLLDLIKFEINAYQQEEKETWKKTLISVSHPIKCLKNKNGQKLRILGLNDNLVQPHLPSEKRELHKYAIADIEEKIKQLINQKKMFSDLLGSHALKIYTTDSLLSEEQEQLAQLHKYTGSRLEQACQLVNNNNLILQQLAYFTSRPKCELMKTSYTSLKDKANHLHNTTSILKCKVEQRLYEDKKQTKLWNDRGDNLKMTLKELNKQLKGLQKTLHEYERKEETSTNYKEIVANYSRTQRQLQHKVQTLSVLNNPDCSF